MDEIHQVQLNIFKEFIGVCEKLEIKYYLVHGSLLGAVRYKGFFPYDDDIDVAMPRKDYDIFIAKAQRYLSDNLFVQCYKTEHDYPLVFAKLRDSNTTFIQPALEKLNVNKGIYIDIFPIDFYPENKIQVIKTKFIEKLYKLRIIAKMNKKRSILKKAAITVTKILLPNWNKVMLKLDNLYVNINSNKCLLHGGKSQEKGIDFNIFGEGKKLLFEGLKVRVPSRYEEYLNIIYGDYKNFSPSAKYMLGKDMVEVSAKIIDVNKSYKAYKE